MRWFALVCVVAVVAGLAGSAGCDSLAGSDYVGEPLFSLSGSFALPAGGARATPVGGVALLWQDAAGAGGPGVAATALPVATAPPATFHVDRPRDAARGRAVLARRRVELAEAYVFVVADPAAARVMPRGLDRTHVLIYANSDVAGGLTRRRLPRRAGRARAITCARSRRSAAPGTAQQQLIARCIGRRGARTGVRRRGARISSRRSRTAIRSRSRSPP